MGSTRPRRASSVLAAVSVALLATAALLLIGVGASSGARAVAASPGANFVATGHDMDFHCSGGEAAECDYLKIVLDKVRNGSSLPVLALDHGSEVATAMTAAGYAAGTVQTVDPDDAATFNATKFVTAAGAPRWSAIVTASDATCGGCDNTATSIANINARAADFATFFNHGGGILALAGAQNFGTYYKFVPLTGVSGVVVAAPFTVRKAGADLGVTDAMVNCCATHNSFELPSKPLVTLETDSAGSAETIAAFGVTIGSTGFTSPPPSTSTPPTTVTASSVVPTTPVSTSVSTSVPTSTAPILAATGTPDVPAKLGTAGALLVAGFGLLVLARRRAGAHRH